MKYQGWTNEPTWARALYIDNDYTAYLKAISMAKTYCENKELALMLQGEFGIGRTQVNWNELAEHYLVKVKEGC
jgi:Cys-tRNA synthase (O-phospho-L-seryl-tRNA:Cys-tRNA synthase)